MNWLLSFSKWKFKHFHWSVLLTEWSNYFSILFKQNQHCQQRLVIKYRGIFFFFFPKHFFIFVLMYNTFFALSICFLGWKWWWYWECQFFSSLFTIQFTFSKISSFTSDRRTKYVLNWRWRWEEGELASYCFLLLIYHHYHFLLLVYYHHYQFMMIINNNDFYVYSLLTLTWANMSLQEIVVISLWTLKKFQEYESQMSERMDVYARLWRPSLVSQA